MTVNLPMEVAVAAEVEQDVAGVAAGRIDRGQEKLPGGIR